MVKFDEEYSATIEVEVGGRIITIYVKKEDSKDSTESKSLETKSNAFGGEKDVRNN